MTELVQKLRLFTLLCVIVFVPAGFFCDPPSSRANVQGVDDTRFKTFSAQARQAQD